ncbi:response regulator transcription factor [Occultella kanbiaonis]|uniref:response regulator transcription factor n=1 Tax=Occultella kanbiaonis TaxID=2675754 RepID=UPI0012B7B92F|nr:response regulator transcription factor [Occultella kanbiaonis]
MTTVVLVDDQAVVRAGFEVILRSEGIEVVGQAAGGVEGVRIARELRPDVVCMDVRMPGGDGITATRALAGPDVADPIPVLVVTTFDLDDYVFGALEAGASGFLLKDADPDVLVDAVRRVASGEGLVDQSLTRRVLREFATRRAATPRDVAAARLLTAREHDILGLLCRGSSNAEIAAALHLEASTVKTHLSRIMTKTDSRDRVQLVVWAYSRGIAEPA